MTSKLFKKKYILNSNEIKDMILKLFQNNYILNLNKINIVLKLLNKIYFI